MFFLAGNTSIVVGSSNGTMVAVTPYDILWKCRLSEVLKQEERVSSFFYYFRHCRSYTSSLYPNVS